MFLFPIICYSPGICQLYAPQSSVQNTLILKRYFQFYNYERPHLSLNGQTPVEVYNGERLNKIAV
ncbi:transposase [Endozoicomonas sp. SM1973]|uniref:Transposase n=1 Tax=Spartinivicinus marinus TaxID=2994442 RepID=A0A853II27_9GAMM|nr:transposase [Spartinivicinus marinus]